MTSNNAVISLCDVDFAYDGNVVLEKVTFDINEGEFAAVIGPNGAGKTTLLRLMLGLLEPRRGSIRIFGGTPLSARKRIGYMPQYPRLDDNFPVTAMDVVMMGRLGHGPGIGPHMASDKKTAERALEEVSCANLKNKPFSALSSGQRQRVLIARALAAEPELLLFDEPTTSLDPEIQSDLYELLHVLNARLTVIIVSHDIGFVSKHVGKIACVNRRVVLHSASEIKGDIVSMLYGEMGVRIVDHDSHAHDS
ncbi:MAG: ABC transporter ATP-binding protein [Candidatus Latescibacterota bacterium]